MTKTTRLEDAAYDGAFDGAYETHQPGFDRLENSLWESQMAASLEAMRTRVAVHDLSERIEDVTTGVAGLSEDLTRLHSTVFGGLADLRRQGEEQSALLADMIEVGRNPRAVAAAELYHRGRAAIERGFLDEGLADLEASLEQDPYKVHTRFAYALGLARADRHEEALRQFQETSRHCAGRADLIGVDAYAVLLASEECQTLGLTDRRRELLTRNADRFAACPEFQVATAAATHDHRYLTQAFRVSPALATTVAAGGTSVDAAADDLARDPDSSLSGILAAHRTATDLQLVSYGETDPLSTPTQALLRHAWFHREVTPVLDAEIRRFHADRQAARRDATLDITPPEAPVVSTETGRTGIGHVAGGVGLTVLLLGATLWSLLGAGALLGPGPTPSFGERVLALLMTAIFFFIPAAVVLRFALPRFRRRLDTARAENLARRHAERQAHQRYAQYVVQWQARMAQRAAAEAWNAEREPLAERFAELERALQLSRTSPRRVRMLVSDPRT